MALRYRAFISYSHEDLQFARELHEWLESFQMPLGIEGSTNRLAPIFRDEGELAAGQLSRPLQDALLGSDALVIVASEASARSEWVAKEIRFFRRHAPQRPRLAIIPGRGSSKAGGLAALIPRALLTRRFLGLGRFQASDVFAPEVDKYGTEGAFLRVAAGILKVDFSKLLDRHERRERAERQKRRKAFASAHAAPLIAAFEEDDWPRLFASALALIQQSRDSVYGDPAELIREAENFVKDLGLAAILLDSAAPITAVRLSPRKDRLFLGLADGTCRLFDTDDRREIVRVRGHTDRITKVSFSPDGALLLTAGRDKSARIWDGSTGTELVRLMGAGIINDAEFTADGALLATADHSCRIQFWQVATGVMISQLAVSTPTVRLAFSRDGRYFGFALENGEVHALATVTGIEQSESTLRPVFAGKSTPVLIAFSKSGSSLVSAFADGTFKLFKLPGA